MATVKATTNQAAAAAAHEEVWKDDDFLSFNTAVTAKPAKEQEEKKSSKQQPVAVAVAAIAVDTALKSSRGGGAATPKPPVPVVVPVIEEQEEQILLPPPWIGNIQAMDSHRFHPMAVLHNEIVGFCRLMEPLPEEIQQRAELMKRVEALIYETFAENKCCKVEVFGSQATGLYLPTSDIDLVVQLETAADNDGSNEKTDETGQAPKQDLEQDWDKPSGSPLERLAQALREKWMPELSYLEVIPNTRVPLVKFCHSPTGIQVDVCFDQLTGPPAAALMKTYLVALAPLRPLTFVLKYFLAARGLNEPYSGGVGSFMLQLMIVAFLQHRERDAVNYRRPSLNNLGCMLLDFLEFYGSQFNYITTGISVRHDGFFFPKGATDRIETFWQPSRPFSLAMENPLDTTCDVGRPSFRVGLIQRAFILAFRILLAHVTPPLERTPNGSILETILPPTEEMRRRATINPYRSAVQAPVPSVQKTQVQSPPKKKQVQSPPKKKQVQSSPKKQAQKRPAESTTGSGGNSGNRRKRPKKNR